MFAVRFLGGESGEDRIQIAGRRLGGEGDKEQIEMKDAGVQTNLNELRAQKPTLNRLTSPGGYETQLAVRGQGLPPTPLARISRL